MIRFAVFTDLHHDFVPEGMERLEQLLNRVKEEKTEFIVSLGDLCLPTEENRCITEKLKCAGVPVYFAIGNHDIEHAKKQEVLNFYELEKDYYSFTRGNVKFIILNSCYMEKNGIQRIYHKKDYDKHRDKYPIIPEKELDWLKTEMQDENMNYVIFSHHSLSNDFPRRGIVNRDEARCILESRKVLLCMNGHDHGDDCKEIHGIPYYTLNSMTYIWHGMKPLHSYPEEIHSKYPLLKDVILYRDALSCIVEIEETKDGVQVQIHGMESDYDTVTPKDAEIGDTWNGVSILPRVSDYSYCSRK